MLQRQITSSVFNEVFLKKEDEQYSKRWSLWLWQRTGTPAAGVQFPVLSQTPWMALEKSLNFSEPQFLICVSLHDRGIVNLNELMPEVLRYYRNGGNIIRLMKDHLVQSPSMRHSSFCSSVLEWLASWGMTTLGASGVIPSSRKHTHTSSNPASVQKIECSCGSASCRMS